ncbi:MAG: GGDEF domain-containing protein [Candidatus Brocadiaceae bacterium]|uniref:sensor domain-containing diguanylate cyclase n=1 Tax=Candidatus Wunengus sp. YC61 TaxID=3367698 RepID=UPI002724AE07|nr:GGDEF domain-containing protein [Candidatus Brocadiaceae bacterium]
MTKDDVLKIVLESPSLPTLPTVACKLISISSSEETGMRDIANLISKDTSLSAKVLKIANSAFYNFPCKISTIQQAALRIGTNVVRSLVLSISFFSIKAKNKKDVFNYERFWEQSLANAVAAKLIMSEIGKTDLEEIFISGLLQNIGEMIIAICFPQQYGQVLLEASRSEKDIIELEEQIIGADHTFIGYEVAKNWGFPTVLLTPIQYHHCPEGYKGNHKKLTLAVNVVYLSGILTNIIYSKKPLKYHQIFVNESKRMLGFNDKIIDKILALVATEIAQTASLFGFHIQNPRSIEEILQEASAALGNITLAFDQMNRNLVTDKAQLQKLTKDLEEKNKRLEKLSLVDGLTKVYNYRYLQSFLDKQINLATRKNSTLSLILADADYFKRINDNYGHLAGDFVLKELCKLMRKSLRDYDIIARYGGEEFAIVLVETTGQEALIVAEKLRKTIATHSFIYNKTKCNVTVSLGLAEIKPAVDAFTKNDLISFADKALFESKKKGRNRVTLYAQEKN